MNAQSAKTPTPRESVTLELTAQECALLICAFSDNRYDGNHVAAQIRLKVYASKSGDACRHSAQSSDAVGQGGTITCHLCEGQGTYTKLNSSKLFECEWCRGTGLRSVEGDSSFMQCHSPD